MRKHISFRLLLLFFAGFFLTVAGNTSSMENNRGNSSGGGQNENRRWGRDPFYRERPQVNNEREYPAEVETEVTNETVPDFLLSAIIFRNGIGVAIINDRIVRRGDMLDKGVVVKHISSDKVILREGKRTVVLRVQPFRSN